MPDIELSYDQKIELVKMLRTSTNEGECALCKRLAKEALEETWGRVIEDGQLYCYELINIINLGTDKPILKPSKTAGCYGAKEARR